MLNSLRTLSKQAEGGAGSDEATEVLEPLLQDEETVQYVLTSSKGIEQTTDGRTTTVEPGSGHDAYAIVTDYRVLFLVGSNSDDPSIDIEFALSSITMCKERSSLLSTSLVVVSEDTTTVKFVPSNGPDLEDVVDYIDRVGSAWVDLERAIAGTRESIDAFAEALKSGEDAHEYLTQARQRLSNAHHHATRNDDGPVEQMLGMIEPVEADLDQLQVQVRLDRVEELLKKARNADSFDDAVQAVVEASHRLEESREVLDDDVVDLGSTMDTIEDREATIDDVATSLLDDVEERCHDAMAATDPAEAAATWETALEQYRTVIAADWNQLGGVDEAALRYQASWVVGRRIDALWDLSASLEADGDDPSDGDDTSTEYFEEAKDHVETARQLAKNHSHADVDRLVERINELEEKIEVSEWQWGDA